MNPIKNVYFSGIGAIGSIFASKIHDMNPKILKVIADEARIKRYTKNPVSINKKGYDFTYITPEQSGAPADLMIISVKQHQLKGAIKDLKNYVGKHTILMSLLNGIESEQILEKEFTENKILYAFCVGQDAIRNETQVTYTHIGKIVLGDPINNNSSEVLAVKELFERSQIPYEIPENIVREQWWKFMLNVGINQVSTVLGAPYGVFQTSQEAMELVLMASEEVITLSKMAGVNLTSQDLDRIMTTLHKLSPQGKTSMLQDMEARRKTEVEIFAGSVIKLGEKYGIQVPINKMLYNQIQVLEKNR